MTRPARKYAVNFTSAALRQLKKLPSNVSEQILEAAEALAANPRPPGATKLSGRPAWRNVAVVMLALFGQMERTYAIERAAHARAVATAKGKRIGRPSVVDPEKLAYAEHLRDQGRPISEIVKATGIARSSLYRHLPPRPPQSLTV